MLVMPKSDARWIYQLGTRGPGLALKQGLDLDLESHLHGPPGSVHAAFSFVRRC